MLLGKYTILMPFHIVPCISKKIISSLDGVYHIKLGKEYLLNDKEEFNKFWIQSQNKLTRIYFDYAHEYCLNKDELNIKSILIKNLLDSNLVSANFDVFYVGFKKELKQIVSYKDIEWNNNKIVFKSAKETTLNYKNNDIKQVFCVMNDTYDIEVRLNKVIFMPKNKIFEILKNNSLTFKIPLKQLSKYCEWETIKENKIQLTNEEKKPEKQKPKMKHFKIKVIVGVVVPLICVILLILLFYSYDKTKCTKIESTFIYFTI